MKIVEIQKRVLKKKKEDSLKRLRNQYDEPMEIIDSRDHEFFIVDDVFVDEYMRVAGAITTVVYLSLLRHANKDRESWPSIRRMAYQGSISRRSVMRGLKWLEEYSLIKTDRVQGEFNRYRLLNTRKWKKLSFQKVVSMNMANKSSLRAFRELNHMGEEE